MTVNVARRRSRARPAGAPEEPQIAIGEIDQTIFGCPACARPLPLGASRCPGCGTRLVMGVQMRRAFLFTAAGLFVGILLGAGGLFAAISIDRLGHGGGAAAQAAIAATASQPAASGPAATPRPSGSSTLQSPVASAPGSGVPALGRSALGQAVALNGRIRESGAALGGALTARRFDAPAVSQILRTLSSDAVVGLGLTPHIRAWPGGVSTSTELTAFYGAIKATAADGLSASVRNEKAYRTAATRMVELLGGLDAVDAVARATADAAGVTLPEPSTDPGASGTP